MSYIVRPPLVSLAAKSDGDEVKRRRRGLFLPGKISEIFREKY